MAMETTRHRINWAVTPEELKLIDLIVGRAAKLAVKYHDPDWDHREMVMDITACHANGNPLRLADLLAADEFNFTHDVFGIRRHIDRTTGELRDCFVPRFTHYDLTPNERKAKAGGVA